MKPLAITLAAGLLAAGCAARAPTIDLPCSNPERNAYIEKKLSHIDLSS